jgi:dTDP-4-dehydrorhamnose 3,5-epimerase-like enzyme
MAKKPLYKIITIPTIVDEASLSFAETKKHIPFPINRFYMIYNADEGNVRGKHAHQQLEQVLFCIHGKLKIVLDTGEERKTIILDKPSKGLYLGNMIWREMHEFKKDTVLFVVASKHYNESDYIRDYATFKSIVNKRKNRKTLLSRAIQTCAHFLGRDTQDILYFKEKTI